MDPTWASWVEKQIDAERGLHITTPKPDAHSDVVVPSLQALCIGGVIAGAITGLVYLVGAPWAAAWRWGLGAGLTTFAGCEVWFLLQHRWVYGAGVRLTYDRFWSTQARPARPEPRRPLIVINPRKAPSRPGVDARPAVQVMEQTAPILEQPDPEIVELYHFVTALWPTRDISRDNARAHGFGRACWERFIGGMRGQAGESSHGLLDRAGMVKRTPAGWVITAPMGAALAWNDELRRYAHTRRDGRTGPGPDNTGSALQLFRRERGGQ